MNIQNFISELKRRNVFRVATAYAIAGWLIIQVVTSINEPLGLPVWFDTAIIVLTFIGFPLALIFAWAFELTPDGIKLSNEVAPTESVTDSTGKKINRLIITTLSVALVFVLVERFFFAKASILQTEDLSAETASIAVLPFVNMSSDQENEYFSDGLSEELLNALAKIEDMQVAGRTSSFKFKGQNENLTEIGGELGVANILEGSVRKSGSRLRITAQLIRVSDGFHMWSETYDREYTVDNIFDIQEEISRHVMEELKVRLLPQEEIQLTSRPTQDIEAYNAYLAAGQVASTRRAADLERAIELYEQAIRLDPGFAEAYAKLAFTYDLLHSNGDIPLEEMKQLMRENIDKALALDENLAIAYKAEAGLHGYNLDRENRLKSAKKAYELSPNDASIVNTYYIALGDDQLEEKYRILKKAYRLDPLSGPIATNYANYLINQANEYEKAMTILDETIERYPDYASPYEKKAWLLRDTPYGELDKAFEFAYTAYMKNPENLDLMNLVSQIARDVDLDGIPEYMAERSIKLYPNNNEGYRIKLTNLLYDGELEEAEDIIDGFTEIYGPRVRDFFRVQLSYIYYVRGEYEKGIEVLSTGPNSEVLETGLIENDGQSTITRFYSVFLEKMERNEEAEEWRNKVENYLQDKLSSIDDSETYNKIATEIDLSLVQKDFKKSAEILERTHFEINSKANWPLIFNTEIQFFEFKESPWYADIRQKIDADLAVMRGNIISFLKKEGEWREEWDD